MCILSTIDQSGCGYVWLKSDESRPGRLKDATIHHTLGKNRLAINKRAKRASSGSVINVSLLIDYPQHCNKHK